MNKLYIIFTLVFGALFFTSCDKDDEKKDVVDYAYHAHINSPNNDTKHIDDTVHVHIVFESHSGEPVHHVNVRVFDKADGTELYNEPSSAHVHAHDGVYEYHDDIVLSVENGFAAHHNYVLEAKVWGEEAGEGEEIESVEFHVHMQ